MYPSTFPNRHLAVEMPISSCDETADYLSVGLVQIQAKHTTHTKALVQSQDRGGDLTKPGKASVIIQVISPGRKVGCSCTTTKSHKRSLFST